MVAIVDYGVGNLFSLKSSLDKIGEETIVTTDIDKLSSAERIILPGVGAFGDAVKKMKEHNMFDFMKNQANSGKAILGICLGMQLMFEKGYEYGVHEGLGLIKGCVKPISEIVGNELKIPHMGWNSLEFRKNSKIFKYMEDGDFVYFVHSYDGAECDESISSVSDYGAKITASVETGNVYGCQFHPEKSGDTGLKILKAFCEI